MARELKEKESKKKGRRLKKSVRKTLGTLCLVSAILTASIPTEGLKQVSADEAVAVAENSKLNEEAMASYYKIPDLSSYKGKIYTTGDGDFQFAYVDANGTDSGSTKFAVILGYSQVGELAGGTLRIPDTVDAYLNYRTNDGTGQGYVAVGQSGNYLFYRTEKERIPAVTASNGDVITPEQIIYEYNPCTYSTYSVWGNIDSSELYYYKTEDFRPANADDVPELVGTNGAYMRIKEAMVAYIGNQYLESDSAGGWTVKGNVDRTTGIFADKGSIVNLVVGENLSGIGNYAFYSCTSMRSITLSNALNTIGNYAFAGCINMDTVSMNVSSNITAIGAHAFEDCQALTSFTVPVNVKAIGDAAFKGCWALRTIDLCGDGQNVMLNTLGCDLFVDCRQLQSLTFPQGFKEDVDISNFEGCLSLGSITVRNTTMNITEGFFNSSKSSFGYDAFKAQYNDSTVVHGTFYFEGPTNATNPSVLHRTAMDNYFAFSYLNESDLKPQDIYELTTKTGEKKAIYRVNSSNVLIGSELDDGIASINLPEYIGPYYIKTIGSSVFQNYCAMKSLTVPSTVEQINADAFSGCHNLAYVTFENPMKLSIEDGAFQTQNVGAHKSTTCDKKLLPEPKLTFVGPISLTSAPFLYAMKESNKINIDNQKDSYITYFSGWPTGLVVEYNPKTDKNELRDYPTLHDLQYASSSTMYRIYNAIDPVQASEYSTAMSGAYDKFAAQTDNTAETGYETQIWDSVMDIVLPEGIEGIEAGLFLTKEAQGDKLDEYFGKVGSTYKTLTAYGLKEVSGDDNPDDDEDTGCFANCDNFSRIALYGNTVSIGDYAFKGCTNLTSVTVPNTVTEIGKIPFTGCGKLSSVDFQGSTHFNCDNSIIYQLDSAGNKYKLVEFLEGRATGNVSAAETAGIKAVAEEAFSGTKASFVDLSNSQVERILEGTFADCGKLISVILPNTLKSVANRAFTKCTRLQRLEIPNMTTIFYDDAVDTSGDDRPEDLVFVCNEDSLAAEYARKYQFDIDPNGMEQRYKVTWEDWDGSLLKEEYVIQGMDGVPPKAPEYTDPSEPGHRPGYDFKGWNKDYTGVSEPMTITAVYETSDPNANKVWVYFYDEDRKTELADPVQVTIGQKVKKPANPTKAGYAFIGWIGDTDFDTPITRDTYFYAQWEKLDGRYVVRFINDDGTVLNQQLVNPGEDAYEPKTPEPALAAHNGWKFAGWIPANFTKVTKDLDIYATYTDGNTVSGGGNDPGSNDPGSNDPNGSGGNGSGGNGSGGNGSGGNGSGGNGSGGNGSGNTNSTFYTLTVQNGSGSGSYIAGSQPVIVANDPPSGQEFSNWTIEPSDTKIASTALSATVVTMPEKNVTVTAHYKTKTGTTTGGGSSSNNNSNNPTGNSGAVSSGTTVVIDKNGLSNTGVVSATVRGSSDNFTIKITESTLASEAIVKALQAEYGDISNIKYFPMDISLYDSTGTKLITDTTGLSVTITLPLPDSLITYAGNNKVAGVVNNKLDKLSPKFTTIDKVACVTFTAEHFSPYVIYVETNNLLESTVVDSTPKTGDGIHPKWFLAIGLACVSVVLFMKKDKRRLPVAKTA